MNPRVQKVPSARGEREQPTAAAGMIHDRLCAVVLFRPRAKEAELEKVKEEAKATKEKFKAFDDQRVTAGESFEAGVRASSRRLELRAGPRTPPSQEAGPSSRAAGVIKSQLLRPAGGSSDRGAGKARQSGEAG